MKTQDKEIIQEIVEQNQRLLQNLKKSNLNLSIVLTHLKRKMQSKKQQSRSTRKLLHSRSRLLQV